MTDRYESIHRRHGPAAIQALAEVVEWAALMGDWDADCWDRAKAVLDAVRAGRDRRDRLLDGEDYQVLDTFLQSAKAVVSYSVSTMTPAQFTKAMRLLMDSEQQADPTLPGDVEWRRFLARAALVGMYHTVALGDGLPGTAQHEEDKENEDPNEDDHTGPSIE